MILFPFLSSYLYTYIYLFIMHNLKIGWGEGMGNYFLLQVFLIFYFENVKILVILYTLVVKLICVSLTSSIIFFLCAFYTLM